MKKLFKFVFLLLVMSVSGLIHVANSQSLITGYENISTDATVYAVATDDTRLVIGGNFTRVGERTPYGAIVDGTSADVISNNPVPNDDVKLCKSDGSGGFYIAGDFTEIGGISRAGLAHINSAGAVSSWNPSPNAAVAAMAVVGSTVYVGGSFTTIGGQSRQRLAAINSSGTATSWDPSPNSTITVLEADASSVYVAGNFTTIGGQSRSKLAEISASTGLATTWDPAPSHAPLTIAVSGNDLYVGGQFTTIAGVSQDRIAKFDMSTGNLASWDPNPSATVYDIVTYGNDVIVGGLFTAIGGTGNGRVAQIDGTTAIATSWDSDPSSTVFDLAMDGDILYMSGAFSEVANRPRTHIAAYDMSTETLLDWNPGIRFKFNGTVLDLAAGSGNVYVGGIFTGIGGERRLGLAVLDKTTLALDNFDVEIGEFFGRSSVYSLAISGNDVIIGGDFSTVGGSSRDYLASISLSTGLVTSWNPTVTGDVNTMVLDGTTLYLGGAFGFIDGQTRSRAAAVNIQTEAVLSWDPNLNNAVNDIAVSGSSVYLTGQFTTAGGSTRNRIVSVDAITGTASAWDPNLNNTGETVLVGPDDNIYVGGSFTSVGSDARNRLASIDPSTALATSWNPNAEDVVYDLVATDNFLYAAGAYNFVGGETKRALRSFDIATGIGSSWDLQMFSGAEVRSVIIDEESIFFFGEFDNVLGMDLQNGAAVTRTNDAPFDITLSNSSISENTVKSSVGNLSSNDDAGDTHTFTLVSGTGSSGNSLFTIVGNVLRPASALDYERNPSASIRVRSTDQNGNYIEEVFSITVNNVIETGNDIASFSFSAQTSSATIDNTGHTVTINVEPGTDVTSLLPTVEVSSGANFSPSGAQNFTSNVNYTVTAEDGSQQVWVVSVTQQYDGIYTVESGGDFETPALANSAINATGIAGDVTLELDGLFTSGFSLFKYDGTTEHSLTIRPTSDATSVQTGQITLRGVENVTIDGEGKITVIYNSTSGYAIWLDRVSGTNEETKNIVIKNLIVQSPGTGMLASSAETLLIDNNRFELHTSVAPGNTVRGITLLGSSGTVSDVTISNNVISFDDQINGGHSVQGIDLQGTMISGTSLIYNNVISLKPNDTGFVGGLILSPQAFEAIEVYHNTISLDVLNGTGSGSTQMEGIRFAIDGSRDPSIRQICKNNIIELGNMFSSDKYGFRYINSDTPLVETEHNNVSNNGVGTFYYGTIDGVTYDDTNLSTLQGLLTGFTNAAVNFTDPANNDYSLTGVSLSQADLRGTPIASVAEDILNTTRSTTAPSRGAYESPNNITDITGFTFTNQEGNAVIDVVNHTVTAQISNGSDLTNVTPTITTFSGSSINPISGVAQDFSSPVNYTVTAEASNTQQWTVTITEFNNLPTDITLSSNSIDENNSTNDPIGTLSTTDADVGDTFTYSKVAGTGDTDNASFNILGNQLRATDVFDFETKSSYSVRLNTNDGNGGNFEKAFTITVDDISETPTDISLDVMAIAENNSVNDVIGQLSTTDDDGGETYTYTKVAGTGDTDNASFNILGNQLRATDVFDFETKSSYSVRLNTNDGNGGNFEKAFTITVNDISETPTDILLDVMAIAENNSVNDVIGQLSTTDDDGGETYTYTKVAGTGDADNASFNILGNQLRATDIFDFETKSSYSVRLNTNDGNGGNFEKAFTITINDISETPTDISLDVTAIAENNSVNDVIGQLSTIDDDGGEAYTYTKVAGTGDTDNASFNILNNQLRATDIFDFETKNAYSIRIQTNDGNGGIFAKSFSISINNVNEVPTGINLSSTSIVENSPINTQVGIFTTDDEDIGNFHSYSFVAGAGDNDNSSFQINSFSKALETNTTLDFETKNSYSIRVQTDDNQGGTFTRQFTINIVDVSEVITWNGSAWDNGSGPTNSDDAVIDGDYSINTDGTFDVANITINNGSTFTVDGENVFSVQADLTINGGMVVESGSSLITFDANTISGNNITFKRNTRYADGKYSFVGSPVEQDVSITGSGLGTFVYKYDETVAYGANDGLSRWIDASSDQLIPGTGYTQANQKEIIFNGMPNTGTVVYSGTYTEDTDDANEGWNLVSNPYAAAIDVADFLSANTNIVGSIYLWDDNCSDVQRGTNADYIVANGIAATQNSQAGNDSRYNQALGSSQGFFVKLLNNSNTNITFNEDMRVSGSNSDNNFFRKTEIPFVRLNLTNEDGLFKQAIVGWAEDAKQDQISRIYDAPAINANSDFGIFTSKVNQTLSIQGLSLDWEKIPLELNIGEAGVYQISIDTKHHQGSDIFLVDNLLNKTVNLTDVGSYTFETDILYHSDRFDLVSAPNQVLAVEDQLETNAMIVFSNTNNLNVRMEQPLNNATVTIYNINGTLLKQVEHVDFTGADWTTPFHSKGLFIIAVQSEKAMLVKKFVKK